MVTLGNEAAATNNNNSTTGSSSTRVIAACTLLVGHPGPSTPTHGDIDVSVSASPLSGPRFDIGGRESVDASSPFYNYVSGNINNNNDDSGKNNSNSSGIYDSVPLTNAATSGSDTQLQPTDIKEIESWIRRTIRSSRFIDPTELGIEPGKSAWRIRISIQIINHDGNLWDAALLCACAALGDLRLPMVEVDRRSGGVRIVSSDDDPVDAIKRGEGTKMSNNSKFERRKGQSLTLGPLPVPLTVAILPSNKEGSSQNILLVDPTHLEEDVSSGNSVTVVCNTNKEIVEFHKKGSSSRLSVDQITAVASMGFGRAQELETLVKG
jgi:exosome complex RNA-binding protein Rrp42 (RNase PH superfamily)